MARSTFPAWSVILLGLSALVIGVLVALLPGTAAAQGYGLSPGDTLRVEVLEDPSLNRTVLVAPDGRISLPIVGTIKASGRSVEAVQSDISARLAPNFAAGIEPSVYVALQGQAPRELAIEDMISVYVVGEAVRPGKFDIAPDTTILQFFGEMGGFSNFAAKKRLQLRRGGKIYGLNYSAIEAGTSNAGATVLSDGDVIIVPQRGLFE